MRIAKFLPAALLVASLGIFGIAGAQEDGGPNKPGNSKEWGHHHDGGAWSGLPEDKRKLLHDTMEKVWKENAPLHEQKRKLKAELDAIMVAAQFDNDAYQKKLAELDDLKKKAQDNKRRAFSSILASFSQEDRVQLVVMKHMMEIKKHHHMHHHDGDGYMGKMNHPGHGPDHGDKPAPAQETPNN